MKRYWDHSDKEKSEFTEQQVALFLDIELMEKGVLKPVPPVLEPVDQIDLPTKPFFQVKHSGYRTFDPIFANIEDALAFTKMAILESDTDYQTGKTFVKEIKDVAVEPVNLSHLSQRDEVRIKLVEAHQRKTRNDKAMADYQKAQDAAVKACEEIWNDWRDCRNTLRTMERVASTKAEYVKLAGGDEKIADTFLAKAFSEDEISAYRAWFGLDQQDE